MRRNTSNVKHTFQSWKVALDAGRIKPLEAICRWTVVAAMEPMVNLKPYAELIRETLPRVEWLGEGEHVLYSATYHVDWTCPSDFFEWADSYLGHSLSIGKFLTEYIAEADKGKRDSLVTRKQDEIFIRRGKARALQEQGLTQREIAEELGVSRPTIASDLSEKSVRTEKTDKAKRKVKRYEISQYTKPETAANKIIATFGGGFAADLANAIREHVDG